MELEESYFFDTYALYELVHGSENYSDYAENISIITTKLNLMELHYLLLRLYGKEEAEKGYNKFLPFAVEVNDSVIKEASEFRALHKKRSLSYVDCIGYIIAKKSGVQFLTGDEHFKDFENVEFVK